MRLEIRCSEEQRLRWEEAAGLVPLSRWARTVLDGAAGVSSAVRVPVEQMGYPSEADLPVERSVVVGKCGAFAPAGTRCKACGKVHG